MFQLNLPLLLMGFCAHSLKQTLSGCCGRTGAVPVADKGFVLIALDQPIRHAWFSPHAFSDRVLTLPVLCLALPNWHLCESAGKEASAGLPQM